MTPLEQLTCLGVQVHPLDNGNLYLDRPANLTDETWQQAVNLAQEEKKAILQGLKISHYTKAKTKKHITSLMLQAWKTARPWILDHLSELERKGWTRKKLFQAGRFTYPHGPWGPAWLKNWLRSGVIVTIDQDGAIRWTWVEPSNGNVSQAVRL